MSRFTDAFDRLTSLPASSTRVHQRARLLATLHLSLLVLSLSALILVLVVDSSESSRRDAYAALILGLFGAFLVAFVLNRSGHYAVAAALTVAGAVVAPWGCLVLDPAIIDGDIVPLVYVVISVLLSSMLLPTLVTAVLAAAQGAALTLLMVFGPVSLTVNWPSLFAFVAVASFLSIVESVLRRRDIEQIDDQTQQLALSEARLREDTIRDHLTGLFNRRYLEETLEREVRRAARRDLSLGLAMLDLDHFKRFNDAYGHAAGDALLRALGALLKGQVREADIACRYGGEEFLLIMPEASLETTRQRAEWVREEVKRLRVDYKGETLSAVTVSLGVAVFPDHGSSGEAALKAADAALYQAKHEGRDRVVAAGRRDSAAGRERRTLTHIA